MKEMKDVHRHMLGSVYEWAGETRNYTTGRGAAPFAKPEYIESFVGTLIKDLRKENFLKGTNKDPFAKRAAHYENELNAAHPFIDGNGRLPRLFLKDLASQAGYKLEIAALEKNDGAWYKAMEYGFVSGDSGLIAKEIHPALGLERGQRTGRESKAQDAALAHTRIEMDAKRGRAPIVRRRTDGKRKPRNL